MNSRRSIREGGTLSEFLDDLEDLETAEDFLRVLGIPFDQRVVNVNRPHILKRFHDYLGEADLEEADDGALRATYRNLLERAYLDFVASDAITETVFKVHRTQAERHAARFMPLDLLIIRGQS